MKVKVEILGQTKEYDANTTFLDISKEYQSEYADDIMLVLKNNKLSELYKTVKEDCKIEFNTAGDSAGHKTYIRGISFLMLASMYDVLGADHIDKILIEHSIGNGYFCEYFGDVTMTEDVIASVKKRMNEMVEENLPFRKMSIATDEATKLFCELKMPDKSKLFRYRRGSQTNIYCLSEFKDYFYGYMPPSTGCLKYFDLFLYQGGFVFQVPSQQSSKVVSPFQDRPKLFQVLQESNRWGKTMEIDTVGALNDVIAKGKMGELILVQEALQEKKIAEIAQSISEQPDKKFVMIAGPSSSGKTTFSHRLSIQLRTHGLKTHPIAVDDYFVNREKTPLDANGEYNFECLEAIDTKQFNEDMTNLLNRKTVELPTFNFKTGKREYKGNVKTLGDNDILIIEGIHCLNDKLSYSLPGSSKFKIYISALTQLNIDEHNRIPTTDGRLIRRLVRDSRTRGTLAKNTIAMWPSVRKGEEENIFRFQEEADVMFNSAMIYELAVLKQFVEPILFGIEKDCKEYIEAKRLLKFLDYFLGADGGGIPSNSILKEFVGGGCFHI